MKGTRLARSVIASSLLAAFTFALVLAASPGLHERFHPQAAQSEHDCAVTLIAHGKVELGAALPLVVTPEPVSDFTSLPVLCPVWVETAFLGASIFEHAPPALQGA